MTKRYFDSCRTAEELKKSYRQLAKRLHPDAGGNEEEFKIMQAQFASAWEELGNIHETIDGERYRKDTNETAEDFMRIINTIIRFKGVDVELCGSWIWCTGDTRPYREDFRQLKFCWSKSKKAWYYHTTPYRKHHGRELSLEEIRDMYGSRQYSNQKEDEKMLALQA